ncbi:uncharacterized protein TNCV_3929941 [Trichonephila clavipes]|nr:uncharacterized protein TNCV_3929941 [Trichonephila clavipes]
MRRWVGVKNSTQFGHRDPKCLSGWRRHRAPNEDDSCAGMASDEAVGCTCAFLTMWLCSRLQVFLVLPEPGLHVNELSRIQCSLNLLTTQSEWPYRRDNRQADHPAPIKLMILPSQTVTIADIVFENGSHTPGYALHTTAAGKCPSSPEDEQEKQGESRDR